jgi:hypothetical protein
LRLRRLLLNLALRRACACVAGCLHAHGNLVLFRDAAARSPRLQA